MTVIPDYGDAGIQDVVHHAIGWALCQQRAHLEPGWRNHWSGFDARCERAVERGIMARTKPDGEPTYYVVDSELTRWKRACLRTRKVWRVTFWDLDGANTYVADTRSQARAQAVSDIREVGDCSWREALLSIKSVRRA